MNGYYSACTLPDGRHIVLQPDGLTWESTGHATAEDAQAYALALNEWLDSRPDSTTLRPFFGIEVELLRPVTDPTGTLVAIVDRLYEADRKLDALARVTRAAAGH